ncbi:NADH-quinone oxidoreductase subunit NuoK [Spirosoma sp. KNUC1025]|uniref:NADH-quinone oxidoreductase subunit NuoK n=1 Tax=Spirosoma sp. KNUC1025 TaxID=2894082 RepID=UPI00386743DC|nr:NADH-quinone oxidoreductase subunit NuoK [Spirosoma sp. KNUC1025]
MQAVDSHLFLFVGAALFSIGLAVVILKRHAIVVLMGIELMLNAVNINLVAFSQYDPDRLQGQMLALFVMVVAAAESAIALAIVLQVYRHFHTAQLDELNELKQ